MKLSLPELCYHKREFKLTTSKEMLAVGSEVSLIRMSRGLSSLILPGVRQFCAGVIHRCCVVSSAARLRSLIGVELVVDGPSPGAV